MDILLWGYEKLLDIKFVRWLSRFFTQDKISPIIDWVCTQLEERGSLGSSVFLFKWAIGIIIVSFIIDIIVHWSKREQRILIRRFIAHTRIYCRKLTIFIKELYVKIKNKLKKEAV